MRDIDYLPLGRVDPAFMQDLLEQEEKSWFGDLAWDYAPVRSILASFMSQNLLPGYAAVADGHALAYTYFLTHSRKGIVGTVYASPRIGATEASDELARLAVTAMKEAGTVDRIEAQIMPFNGMNLMATFAREGFVAFVRYFMELDLRVFQPRAANPVDYRLVAWEPELLPAAAEVVVESYQGESDAKICEDYRTVAGSVGYIRSLVDNPGCGAFLPGASFVAFDSQGVPAGFVMVSQLSGQTGMIPQVSIRPSHQGLGLGRELLTRAFERLRSRGFTSVTLTVTKKNRRAFEWYQRTGFRVKKEFAAYVWERS